MRIRLLMLACAIGRCASRLGATLAARSNRSVVRGRLDHQPPPSPDRCQPLATHASDRRRTRAARGHRGRSVPPAPGRLAARARASAPRGRGRARSGLRAPPRPRRLRLGGDRLAAKLRERLGCPAARCGRGRRLEDLFVASLGQLVVSEPVRDLRLDELRRRLLDARDSGGEVLLVRVQLRGELAQQLQRGDSSSGFEPGDVRRGAPREGELALGEACREACLVEPTPDRSRVVDMGVIVRCSHREPQSRESRQPHRRSSQAKRRALIDVEALRTKRLDLPWIGVRGWHVTALDEHIPAAGPRTNASGSLNFRVGTSIDQLCDRGQEQSRDRQSALRRRRRPLSAPAFLGIGAFGIVVYQLLPAESLVLGIVVYFVIGLAGVVALTVGTLLTTHRLRTAWALVAASQAMWVVADLLWGVLDLTGRADGRLDRGRALRRRLRASGGRARLDVALGDAGPRLGRHRRRGNHRRLRCARASGRSSSSPPSSSAGARPPSSRWRTRQATSCCSRCLRLSSSRAAGERFPFSLIVVAVSLVFAADLVYYIPALADGAAVGPLTNAAWLGGYIVLGAAGLHRSARSGVISSEPSVDSPLRRLRFLGVALLALPLGYLLDRFVGDGFSAVDFRIFVIANAAIANSRRPPDGAAPARCRTRAERRFAGARPVRVGVPVGRPRHLDHHRRRDGADEQRVPGAGRLLRRGALPHAAVDDRPPRRRE